MSANRFFISASDIEGDRVRLGREQSHQVSHVLRLAPGDTIVVLDNNGLEYDVTLTTIGRTETVGQVTDKRQSPGEPRAEVTLFQSLLAREKFEWVLQKGTEVGVTEFVPMQTERSLVRAKAIDDKRLDRWRRIVVEAAEQAHRGRMPRIEAAMTFQEVVPQLRGYDRALIATTSGQTRTLKEALASEAKPPSAIAVLVGPEGGFSDSEVEQACDNGAIPVGLGPRILRTETAGTVLPALVLYELGDMES